VALPVVYVGGVSRSGSTVLGVMLGQVPGFVWPGEVRWIWRKWGAEDQLCGCGEPFRACPFWTAVAERGFGGWDGVDAAGTVRLEEEVVRFRNVALLRASGLAPGFQAKVGRYAERVHALYEAVSGVAGGATIVDTTKDPPYAFLLARVPGVDLRVVHLARDPRGVAFSAAKRIVKPDLIGREELMPRQPASRAALDYDLYNASFMALGVPRLFVRYESLVDEPRRELARVLEFAGSSVDVAELDWLESDRFRIDVHHSASGNPLRFRRGPAELRRDEEWRERMSPRDRLAVAVLTWPFMLGYGYVKGSAGGR
jgi:Sulfotransferase family